MESLRPFFRQRVWAAGLFALCGLLVHVSKPTPPEKNVEGLSAMLGRAVGLSVDPRDIVWEPRRGFLTETFSGRRVLFLASTGEHEPRDLYRAHVRLTLEGQPISVRRARNLTQTPLGDDVGLQRRGATAVFATLAFGRIQGITALDLSGIRETERPEGWFDRLLLAVSSLQQTGSVEGVGRADIVLDVPAESATITLEPPLLHVDLGESGRELVYNIDQRTLRGAEGEQAYAARALVHPPKPFVHWLVDTVRAEIGAEPIAWLENRVFGARDTLRRAAFTLLSSRKESELRSAVPSKSKTPPDAQQADEASSWPPPPIVSIWKETRAEEGRWKPVLYPFLNEVPGLSPTDDKPPAYFYRTFFRPDRERPYSEVIVIAMDMRRLELGMQAGFEDPKPTTGPPGAGRLPQSPDVYSRIVATFNGAFKTEHGSYGMMVDRRVLVPPVDGAATIFVDDAGHTGLGTWPQGGEPAEEWSAFRQNLDPLVENGRANPTGRNVWGWQLEGESVLTQRTALCVTPAGHLYYFFAKESDGATLAAGLVQAGCAYGIHLDMNPGHSGFVFTDIIDPKHEEFRLHVADEDMDIAPDKFVRWSAKDFFYVMVRDPTPRDDSKIEWRPQPGDQPRPAFIPGIFSGELALGSLKVELVSFEHGRVDFRVRAGSREPTLLGAPLHELELLPEESKRVLAAAGLGHTTEATSYGLAFGGRASLPLRSGYATLVVPRQGPLRLLPPGEPLELAADQGAVQLPLLAEERELLPRARGRGAMRLRSGLCVLKSGRTLLASARHDSSDLVASALLRAGCRRIVELDRGSQHPAFLHRSGTGMPPMLGYETSVLYALERTMKPHAFVWEPSVSDAPPGAGPDPFRAPVKATSRP